MSLRAGVNPALRCYGLYCPSAREPFALPPGFGTGRAGGAAAAGAVDLVAVALDRKTDVGRDLVLQALDVGRGELEDRPAGLADEVVVVLALVVALEAYLPGEGQLRGHSRRL